MMKARFCKVGNRCRNVSCSSLLQPALQAQTTTLAQSGMKKRTKLLIAMGIAGAFAGIAVTVDRGVEDSTPSSLGQR
ncbi:MAG: hypothetical protein WD690_09250 [Vicinamibacterales bacterium]